MLLGAAGAGATFLAQLPVGNYQALSPNSGEMFTYPPSTCVNWWLGDGRGEVSAQGGGSVTSLPPPKNVFWCYFPKREAAQPLAAPAPPRSPGAQPGEQHGEGSALLPPLNAVPSQRGCQEKLIL